MRKHSSKKSVFGWHRSTTRMIRLFFARQDGRQWANSKGYGSDAMHLGLRYAFCELNPFRVSLNVTNTTLVQSGYMKRWASYRKDDFRGPQP